MPKQPAVGRDSLLEVLCRSKEAILEQGSIATPKARVWKELSEQLGNRISAKALYTVVKLNRYNVWSALGFGCQTNDPETSDTETSKSCSPSPEVKHDQEFQLEIPFDKWTQFIPEEVEYKDECSSTKKRGYTILKPGTWTHIINDHIWTEMKSTCTFIFKRAKVFPSQTTNYIVIRGYCKECLSHLDIKCERAPALNNPMVLKCNIKNINHSKHTGSAKRSMSGLFREQVATELCEGRKEPHVWRASRANTLMDFGDPEPSHLPNLATLRKAKQEKKDLELGDKDPIKSLQMLKHSAPHSGSIRDIGLDKFFCHYWSQTQMHIYKTLSKKCHQTVCFDATGSVVKKLVRPNGSSGHIFLYQGVLTGPNCSSVPVVQMLSERHDAVAIAQWLTEWIRAGAPVPKQVVSDFSLAFLGALVKAFTPHPDLKTYINECFGVLQGNPCAKLPPCLVRVDVAHCIKMICQWECLKSKTPRIKDFFVRSIAQLMKSQSLKHAKELIHAITVVALSEAEGSDSSGVPLTSEVCKKYLKAQIAEESIVIPEPEGKELEQADPCDPIHTDLRQWVTQICEESKSLAAADGDRDNIHYLPEIIPQIIRLVSYLPLWTGVMVPFFQRTDVTSSSAAVEAEFRNIKHGLFKHEKLPTRVDRFIACHLSFIEGNMRICAAKHKGEEDANCETAAETAAKPALITTQSNKGDAYPCEDSDAAIKVECTDEEPVENWRGLAVPPKKRKRSSYLSPCPEWLHADPSAKRKRVHVGLLKNGNNQQPVKLGKASISVLNTCAFDAFCQCLCCAYCDSSSFENVVRREESDNRVLQLVKHMATEGVTQQTYSQRAELLSQMFAAAQLKSGGLQVDAQCHISAVIEKTMRNIASVYFMKQCSSQYCSLSTRTTREVPFVSTSVAVLQASGMAHLQTAVEQAVHLPESTCLRPIKNASQCPSTFKTNDLTSEKVLCAGKVTHSYSLGELLWIDTDLGNHSTASAAQKNSQRGFPLCEFPSNLVLQGKTFTLRSVIAYQGGLTQDALGHYVSYCRRAPCTWEMYDDLRGGVTTPPENTRIMPHAALYTKD